MWNAVPYLGTQNLQATLGGVNKTRAASGLEREVPVCGRASTTGFPPRGEHKKSGHCELNRPTLWGQFIRGPFFFDG
jgi:hypothetical protein